MIEEILEAAASQMELPENMNKAELTAKDIKFAHDFLQNNPEFQEIFKRRIEVAAEETCEFFGLPDIPIREGQEICVYMNDLDTNLLDVFEYNPDQFLALRCTSMEDISKVWAHECGHRILRDIYSESWPIELGADYYSGVRSEILGLPSGNFEQSIRDTSASESHPGGDLRVQAINYGREVVAEMRRNGITPTWENCLEAFDASPFSKLSYYESDRESSSIAALVNDKAYHIDRAKSAENWANWHKKEAKEAAARGDQTAVKDHTASAQNYESMAQDALKTADRCQKKLIDSNVSPDTDEMKKTGGSYRELKNEGWGWSSEPPREIHHMPSDESSNLERTEGPCIVMEYDDHRDTASCGNSRDAQEYRAIQKGYIEDGQFREALQMDIDDIHEKFGDKYDEAIEQMLAYVDELEKENRI